MIRCDQMELMNRLSDGLLGKKKNWSPWHKWRRCSWGSSKGQKALGDKTGSPTLASNNKFFKRMTRPTLEHISLEAHYTSHIATFEIPM